MPFLIPIAAAIFTFATTTIVGGLLLSVGVGLLQRALAPKPQTGPATWRGDTQTVSFNPMDPRRVVLGRTATAGALTTWRTWDTNNAWVGLIFRLADHKTHGLVSATWRGRPITIDPTTGAVAEAFADGMDNLFVKYYDGDWNQAADADLVANSGGSWTSNDRLRGVTYVRVKAHYNETAFTGGLNDLWQLVFTIDGAHFYDRRLDTSVGGSGSQRWNDQTTWTLNDNAAVVEENVLRGIRVEDTTGTIGSRTMDTFFGIGLGDADLPFADNIAAMNSCDEAVSLKAGGTEKRYRIGGLFTCDSDVKTVVDDLNAAMAGRLLVGVGRWIIKPGVTQTAVRAFTDADRRLDGPYKYVNDIALESVNNAVFGNFSDPDAGYQQGPLPPRTSTADETTDHQRKSDTLQLNFVTSHTQGQRVMEIHRRRGRFQASAQKSLAPENLDLEAVDWITWTSARYGWTKTFEIGQRALRTDDQDLGMVVLDLAETGSSAYGWNPAVDEEDRNAPTPLASADPVLIPPSASLSGSNMVLNPGAEEATANGWAIDFTTGTAPTFGVDTAQKHSGAYAFKITKATTSDGAQIITRAMPVIPGRSYVFRWRTLGSSATANGLFERVQMMAATPPDGYVTAALADLSHDFVTTGPIAAAWRTDEYAFTIPAGMYWLSMATANWSAGPTGFWFDDIEMIDQVSAGLVAGLAPAATDTTIQPGATYNHVAHQATTDLTTYNWTAGAGWVDATSLTFLGMPAGTLGGSFTLNYTVTWFGNVTHTWMNWQLVSRDHVGGGNAQVVASGFVTALGTGGTNGILATLSGGIVANPAGALAGDRDLVLQFDYGTPSHALSGSTTGTVQGVQADAFFFY